MTTPPSPAPPPRPDPVALFFGWLLLVMGGLIVLLCGGCTLTLWAVTLLSTTQAQGPAGSAGAVILYSFAVVGLIGGVPAACGSLLAWAGWRIVWPRRPRR